MLIAYCIDGGEWVPMQAAYSAVIRLEPGDFVFLHTDKIPVGTRPSTGYFVSWIQYRQDDGDWPSLLLALIAE